MDAMARQGVTTPATQRVARITSTSGHDGRGGGRLVEAEDLVAFDGGVVAAGYAGETGRTWPASPAAVDGPIKDLYRRADELWTRLLTACRPGALCSDLLSAYQAAGEPLPPFPVATGLGLGFDVPVVTPELPRTAATERLEPGMVVSIAAHVVDGRNRAVLRKEAVLITRDGGEVLTSSPHWRPYEQ
jgi:Xaa-Pro aminopeptidase